MGERALDLTDIAKFVPAAQIEADRKIAILESERRTSVEITAVRDDVAGVKRQVEALQGDVKALQSGQGDLAKTLDRMEKSLGDMSKSLEDVSHETEIIKTETADGVEMTKTIRVVRKGWGFLKSPMSWLIGVVTWLLYNVVAAIMREHGMSFVWLVSGGKVK